MKYFLLGFLKILGLPLFLLICFILTLIDVIFSFGGKTWLNIDDHLYYKFSKFYLGD